MNIVLKTTLKNIFGKPFRTFLVILSIFMCSFVAMFSFDLASTEKNLILDVYSKVAGNADLMINMTAQDLSALPSDFPENTSIAFNVFSDYIYVDIEGEPMYATRKEISIYGGDIQAAADFGLIDNYELEDGYTIITDKLAEALEVSSGDSVIFHDNNGEDHEFIVSEIVPSNFMNLMLRGNSAIITANDARILSCNKPSPLIVLLDLKDNTQAEQAQLMIESAYRSASVTNLTIDEDTQNQLNQLLGVMFIVFAITFLLVIFITASICERIVGERMSFIGTLRSLGMDSRGTGLILLIENAFYALIGSIPGVIVYMLIRGPMYASIMTLSTSDGTQLEFDTPTISIPLIVGVIAGAVAIECIIPLRAIIRALRISIRDIIFDNRDTEYKFSRTGIIIGCITGVISVVSFFFRTNLTFSAVCLITGIISLSFLFPLLLKGVSHLITTAAEKAENASWALASREIISKKSTVTSGVLCVTSAAMCIVVFMVAVSMLSMFTTKEGKYNVEVMMTSKPSQYSFVEYMDGVNDYEFCYSNMGSMKIEGQSKIGQVFGVPDGGYRLSDIIVEMPETVEPGTILVEKAWAKRMGLTIGDSLTIVFDPLGVFPIERTFTIADYYELDPSVGMSNNFVINLDEYIGIFHDMPNQLLISADDPDQVADTISKYCVGSYMSVKTAQELIAEEDQSEAQIRIIFTIIIAIALGMTCIGMISNQLIGFEGRKKECAVMLSTAMERGTLISLLFKEMFITAAVSSTVGALVGVLMVFVVKSAIDSSDAISLNLNINIPMVLILWVAMVVIFALTVLFPVRSLRKMKISEQIKYE